MTNELARTYEADGQEITINPNVVARYILSGSVKDVNTVPESEYAKVIMTCAVRKLNPFAGDVAIQPHWNSKRNCTELSVVMTKDYFQRRAESNPNYLGKEYGVIVLSKDGRPIRRDGCGVYYAIGETLMGGWCRVHVKGREVPEYSEVSIAEYNSGYSLWKSKPATMIAKVAKSQALREAFPNEFNGLYEPEEMDVEIDDAGNPVELNTAAVYESEPQPDNQARHQESQCIPVFEEVTDQNPVFAEQVGAYAPAQEGDDF